MTEQSTVIRSHPHLAICEQASSTELVDAITEIMTQCNGHLTTLGLALEDDSPPAPHVIQATCWGVQRQLELARHLFRSCVRRQS